MWQWRLSVLGGSRFRAHAGGMQPRVVAMAFAEARFVNIAGRFGNGLNSKYADSEYYLCVNEFEIGGECG